MNAKSLFVSLLTSLACLFVGCASAASEADLAAEAAGVAYDVEGVPTPSLSSVDSFPGETRSVSCTTGQWSAGHTACNNSGAGYATSCQNNGNGSITVRCSGDNQPMTVRDIPSYINERGI